MEQIVIIKGDGNRVPIQSKKTLTKITKADQRISLIGEDVVAISVESSIPQTYELGDRIIIFGREYTLNLLPSAKKNGNHSFAYDLTFEGVQYELARAQYEATIDTTGAEAYGDALMGNLKRFMDVLIQNINRIFPGQWKLGECPEETETKNLIFSCENCLSVLQRLCQEFEQEFEIEQNNGIKIINIRKSGQNFPFTFQYGKGRGMYELSRQNVSTSNIVTRLKVFGASKNLGSKYRNDRLCLAGKSKAQSYIENAEAVSQYGIWEDTKNFDEIYPKRIGKVTDLVDSIYKFKDNTMFDLNEKEPDGITTKYLIGDVPAKIHFNTGGLAGYQLDIHAYDHATKTFTLKKFTDERGMTFPSETSYAFQIRPSDEYVLLDINLPQSYIDEAETLLDNNSKVFLEQNCQPKVQYGLSIDENYLLKFVGENSVSNIFMVGDYISIKDNELNVDKSIRITAFSRNLLRPYSYSLTIADVVQKSIYSRIISNLIDIDRIIQVNDLSDPSKARRKWQSTQEMLGMIFDPEGDYYSEKIKPGSIETQMLSVGAKSMQFMLQNTMFEANYQGNKNLAKVMGGVLTHWYIEDSIRDWNLSSGTTTLEGDAKTFYIYAKCQKIGSAGTIIFSTSQIRVNDNPDFYHFWVGVVHSVADEVRAISLTYGSTTINGKFIRTGQIESSDGSCFINLDGNSFRIGTNKAFLDWNTKNDGKLRLKGTIVQSPSGDENLLGVFRGSYSSFILYYQGDEITYNGSMYRCLKDCPTTGILPINNEYWQIVAEKGQDGEDGQSGRNLVLNTSFEQGQKHWTVWGNARISITDDVVTVGVGSTSGKIVSSPINMLAGDEFVVSLDVRSDDATNLNYNHIMGSPWGGSNQNFTEIINDPISEISTEWKRLIFKIKALNTQKASIGMGLKDSNGTGFQMRKFKLEQGTRVTPWSPAFEDAIEKAQITADQAQINVTNLNTYVDTSFKDGVISEAEAKAIEKYLNTLDETMAQVEATYNSIYMNTLLEGVSKINLLNSKINLFSGKDNLRTAITSAIADGKTTVAEKNNVDSKFALFNANLKAFQTAVEEANKTIQIKLDNLSTEKVTNIQIGVRNLIKNSNFIKDKLGWTPIESIISVEPGGIYRDILKVVGKIGVYSPMTNYSTPLILGEEYVLSAMIKSDINTIVNLNCTGGAPLEKFDISTQWKRCVHYFKYTEGNGYARFYGVGNTFYLANVMLSKGNKVAPWSPAIEDIQDDIDKAKEEAIDIQAAYVFRGNYSSSDIYIANNQRIDIVRYNNMHYRSRRKVNGSFSNQTPSDNSSYWENFGAQFESIATNLLLAEGASIGNWSIQGGKIVSTLGSGNKISLDADTSQILVESNRAGGEASANPYQVSKIRIDAANGVVEARSDLNVSYISPTGIFCNNAETSGVPPSTGLIRNAAIVGLGNGNVSKGDGTENFVAGVYGTAYNKGNASAYGGYFENLMGAGLLLKTKIIDTSGVYLVSTDSFVIGFSRTPTQIVYLPTDNVYPGQVILVKQWWTGGLRFHTRGGQSIWDDSSENTYFDFGEGQGGIFVFTIAKINGVVKEAWLVNRWKF